MFSEAFSGGGGCDDYDVSTHPLSLEIIKSAPFPTLTKVRRTCFQTWARASTRGQARKTNPAHYILINWMASVHGVITYTLHEKRRRAGWFILD
jgi:hypothetical protein